jgi:hypothetical protein
MRSKTLFSGHGQLISVRITPFERPRRRDRLTGVTQPTAWLLQENMEGRDPADHEHSRLSTFCQMVGGPEPTHFNPGRQWDSGSYSATPRLSATSRICCREV